MITIQAQFGMSMKTLYVVIFILLLSLPTQATEPFVSFIQGNNMVQIIGNTNNVAVSVAPSEYAGVMRAARSLCADVTEVTNQQCTITSENKGNIIVGTIDKSEFINKLIKQKKLDAKLLKGKREKFIITTIDNQLVIAGSDKRGTIYGIYEFARQIGISPWHWWADVPAQKHNNIYVAKGTFTDGEPVVQYRGIFLNDEAPCLSGWVAEKFPDSECPTAKPYQARGFNSNFYEKVFELLLRLKANFMWPAMWGNAFYADDERNSQLADEMGIIMGTSHHEPMARNHQEWARHRKEYGAWDYASNQEVIDNFFREGIRRAKNNEDLITIGMRGDGDAPMGGEEGKDDEYVNRDEYNIKLMQKIFANQRQIIAQETGQPAEKRPQVWALYKEVQRLYDLGLKVPDDVLILLCDDNWGNIRNVPQKQHKGGWGMYYHVDYVGAPRCTKWANVTPIAHMWEQLNLTYQYGIDRLWILNVGDLKPMEYPIDLFLSMAWNPKQFTFDTFRRHTLSFCAENFGADNATKAMHILEEYCRYNGRVTPEMLSAKTYNLHNGEFKAVVNEYKALEAEALQQYIQISPEYRDAYFQLILYPVQSMANLYEMYYAQAQNNFLAEQNDVEANFWADKVEECFRRDSLLTTQYHSLNNGKWNHLMDQTHIGYTSWQQPDKNVMPQVKRVTTTKQNGGYIFSSHNNYISIEAEHYFSAINTERAQWNIIPTYGRTKSAIALMPYTESTNGASVSYKFTLPQGVDKVKIHIITNSTLPFARHDGHRYLLSIDNGTATEVNYNGRYTEDNQWEMYDIVATRVIETITELPTSDANEHVLTITPIDPGMVLQKIVIDYGGYSPSHLFGTESFYNRIK